VLVKILGLLHHRLVAELEGELCDVLLHFGQGEVVTLLLEPQEEQLEEAQDLAAVPLRDVLVGEGPAQKGRHAADDAVTNEGLVLAAQPVTYGNADFLVLEVVELLADGDEDLVEVLPLGGGDIAGDGHLFLLEVLQVIEEEHLEEGEEGHHRLFVFLIGEVVEVGSKELDGVLRVAGAGLYGRNLRFDFEGWVELPHFLDEGCHPPVHLLLMGFPV
jgi:hypothetical protein